MKEKEALVIALLTIHKNQSWKTLKTQSNQRLNSWFICGIGNRIETTCTFILPIEYWHKIDVIELDKEPYNNYLETKDYIRLLKF